MGDAGESRAVLYSRKIRPPITGSVEGNAMTTPAPSSNNSSTDRLSRSVTIEADARMLDRMKKESNVRGFTIRCDEREPNGNNSAPSPLAYFASSILF